jgi:LPXTG-site transpeptidase (sortase) family protein
MTKQEKIQFVAVRSLGNFLVLFALYGVFATFGPALLHEIEFRIIQARGVTFKVSEASQAPQVSRAENITEEARGTHDTPGTRDTSLGFADILAGNKEQVLVPPDTNFSIVIPKLGASAKVFPNVDPGNPNEFLPLLQQGIAHAKGSVFPGMKGNTYLFAHSTDNWWHVGQYNAVFYLLKNLAPGDEIIVFFEGNRYTYMVSQSYIAEATDTTFLTRMPVDSQQLILQTCWPPGTTWKRLFVVAKPKTSARE